MKALAVPSTSAPVERAFSYGPHRARQSIKMLSDLVFLKCNIDKLQCGCVMAAMNFRNRKLLPVLDVDVIDFYKHNKLQ